VLCAVQPPQIALNSIYVTEDAEWQLTKVNEAVLVIQNLLNLYWQGLVAPLPFFPESSLACYEYGLNSKELFKCWNDPNSFKLESQDLAVRIAFRGIDPIDAQFADIADSVFSLMLNTGQNLQS